MLTRAQQDAVWTRTQAANKLRSVLREYFPAALLAFFHRSGGLTRPDARAVLTAAPTPRAAAALTRAQLRAALRRAGRTRQIEPDIDRLRDVFSAEYLHHPAAVEDALGRQALALLGQLDAACTAADSLAEAVTAAFTDHPDAQIITSFPGLGPLSGARILAEIGDDRGRFADARALKAYAGAAPVTRASGKSRTISHRQVKNQRLAACGYTWTLTALRASPGANHHYRRRRAAGHWHTATQRHLFNRLLGQLYHCLQTGRLYQEDRAFPETVTTAAAAAA